MCFGFVSRSVGSLCASQVSLQLDCCAGYLACCALKRRVVFPYVCEEHSLRSMSQEKVLESFQK